MKADALNIGIELINDPAWMGGTLYLRNLAVALARLPERERPRLQLLGAHSVIDKLVHDAPELAEAQRESLTLFARILRHFGILKSRNSGLDVIYPGFGPTIPGVATIRWIPDFQHRYLPHLFSQEECAARDRSIGELASRPGVVVLSSQVALADFQRFYPDAQVTARVWRFCSLLDTTAPPNPEIPRKYGLPEKYLYLPNQFWSHKNHLTVLKALALLNGQHGCRIPLVCTGAQMDPRNEAHFASLQSFIRQHGLEDQVFLLGLIDRVDQVEVLRRAAAVIQPSLFEGWSTVVEDIRATGRPIFLSDLPVHREQSPDRCEYFDPLDERHLAELLGSKWPELKPGPDPDAEQQASVITRSRIEEAARGFIEIARSAMQINASV